MWGRGGNSSKCVSHSASWTWNARKTPLRDRGGTQPAHILLLSVAFTLAHPYLRRTENTKCNLCIKGNQNLAEETAE